MTIIAIIATVLLLMLSALFSGLILGMMSLDIQELSRKAQLGDKYARVVSPIRRKGNVLLVTLIIANVLVNVLLTIVLNNVVTPILAIITITLLVAVFGTILPQAIFSKYALFLGYYLAPIVKFTLRTFGFIARPVGDFLDRFIGKQESEELSDKELLKILDEYQEDHEDLDSNLLKIIKTSLQLGEKTVRDVMVPRTVVEALEENEDLTKKKLKELSESGHSRFPVYKETLDSVIGVLFLHDLVDAPSGKTAGDLAEHEINFIDETKSIGSALESVLRSHHHLHVVLNEFKEMVGIVTLEDLLEEVTGREIVDEFDKDTNLRAEARKEGQERKKQAENA